MRQLIPEEIKIIQNYDGMTAEDYRQFDRPDGSLEGPYEYIEATLAELAALDAGTQCGTDGNKCLKMLVPKFGDRLIRCLYSAIDKQVAGMPRIQCSEAEAQEIYDLAQRGEGSLGAAGDCDDWPEFYIFEVE